LKKRERTRGRFTSTAGGANGMTQQTTHVRERKNSLKEKKEKDVTVASGKKGTKHLSPAK